MRASTGCLRGGGREHGRAWVRAPGSQRRAVVPAAARAAGPPGPYAAGMGELIPLFPLGTPLFPGVVLPLQIFEPRYRRLMRDLLAQPEAGDRPVLRRRRHPAGLGGRAGRPGRGALRHRLHRARAGGARRSPTAASGSSPSAATGSGCSTSSSARTRPTCRPRWSGSPRRRPPRRRRRDSDGLVGRPVRPAGPRRPAGRRRRLGGPRLDGRAGPRGARAVHPLRRRGGRPELRRGRGDEAAAAVDAETAVLLGRGRRRPDRRCPTWSRRRRC